MAANYYRGKMCKIGQFTFIRRSRIPKRIGALSAAIIWLHRVKMKMSTNSGFYEGRRSTPPYRVSTLLRPLPVGGEGYPPHLTHGARSPISPNPKDATVLSS